MYVGKKLKDDTVLVIASEQLKVMAGQEVTTVEKWLGRGLRNLCRPTRTVARRNEDVWMAGGSDG